MKTISMRKLIAAIGAAALLSTAAVAIAPSAYAAAPTCSTATDGVETCKGTLSNGADYMIKVPARYNGTFFYWNHGIKFTYPVPGYITVPTGIEELTPTSSTTKLNVDSEMLRAGYGLATYDGKSTGGIRGWNTVDRVAMLKELIDTVKAKYTVKKGVIYGSSQAGSIMTPFIEQYPDYADAVGIMAGVTPSIGQEVQSLCDMFYILSVFADPTIKGCAAFGVKGLAGHYASIAEFQKVGALLQAWSLNLGMPGLDYPAALKGSGIPQRSALLLTGLLVGIPAKSSHMDGITTSGLVAEQSINATVAILENFGEALATGTFGGQAISEITGPGFYDNTKTNWFSLLDPADAGRYNLGLSGDDGINGMLGVLSLAPRVTGDPVAVAKLKALDASKFDTTKPVVLKSEYADKLIASGIAKLKDPYFVRPLIDYQEAFNSTYVRRHEVNERIAHFKREALELTKANSAGQEMISFRQIENQQLKSDLVNFKKEGAIVKEEADFAEQELAALKAKITEMYRQVQARTGIVSQ
jgi:hypothetical protein